MILFKPFAAVDTKIQCDIGRHKMYSLKTEAESQRELLKS